MFNKNLGGRITAYLRPKEIGGYNAVTFLTKGGVKLDNAMTRDRL